MSAFTEQLINTALAEVGVKEVGSSNRGPRVDQYQRATWLEEKDWGAWCAAFVCWCVRETMKAQGIKETKGFKRPRTAGAFDFERWSLAQDSTTATRKPAGKDIQRGDLVIWSFSHISIALGPPDKQGMLQTVDGNTDSAGSRDGGGVYQKIRNISRVRSRIRFTL
jgi:hypothetical protein